MHAVSHGHGEATPRRRSDQTEVVGCSSRESVGEAGACPPGAPPAESAAVTKEPDRESPNA